MNHPSGNVTFLFTDIEGSTRLSQEFPETIHIALEKHHSILNEAVESWNGYVFEIVGDAFCCAFEKAEDAVKAAVEIQKKLSIEKWEDVIVKIRIGIHSGKAEWTGERYSGYITLARTARLMSAANGEQIIISKDTFEISKDNISSQISFRDLGERRLKDVVHPIRLYQVSGQGLREDFPPLKTIDARPNNLPVQLTKFIGREKEMKEIKNLLSRSTLVTLLGSGGSGKTRLVLEVAEDVIDDFTNGVWFIELASITDPAFIIPEIASVFNLNSDGKKDLYEILKNYLREKEILLVLDNCEHLIHDCAKITEQLLGTCSKLKILASSRESLHIFGEATYSVPSLSMPDLKIKYTAETLSQYESVKLFIDRAISVNPDFKVTNSNAPALAQLCSELDGIPLAIELASARIRVLPVEKILERLNDRFKLLTGGKRNTLPRHQTLRALIDWSYDLLSDNEKLLLCRLSIFNGGWTLEAAENVCSDESLDEFEILDLLSNLLDKSLVKAYDTDFELRYTMLETIRKYGEEKLNESDEVIKVQEKYYNYFYKFAVDSEHKLTGSLQKEYLLKMNSDYENMREVLNRSLQDNSESTLKISVALGKYWELRSYFSEGLNFLQKGLEINNKIDNLLKAKVYYWTGFYFTFQGKYIESKKYLEESLEMFVESESKEGKALTLMSLAAIAMFEGDYEKMESITNESLNISIEINNKSFIAANLRAIAVSLMHQGNHDESGKRYEESLSIYRELGDQVQLAKIIGNFGALEYLKGNYEKAISYMEESLELRYELGDRHGIGISLNNLGTVYSMQYAFDKAEKVLNESLEIFKELGDRRIYVNPMNTLGNIANERKEYSKAISIFKETVAVSNEVGEKFYFAKGIEGLANSHIGLNNYEKGCVFSAKYITMLKSLNTNLIQTELDRFEEITEHLKSKIPEQEFQKLWSKGESMSMDEMVELAVQVEM
ncbi:MAG: tetratricopeptide repeat protein [Ignavibacteria bacterium]|nr:tetratricopeptide repeat protein [Ignavibacteria bacterium]